MNRERLAVAVWEYMADMLGGDGWDDWTGDEIHRAMDAWLTEGADAAKQARELIEDAFDPRDVRFMGQHE